MNIKIKVLAFVIGMGISIQVIAAPCYTSFSYQAAVASNTLAQDLSDCTDTFLGGPCKTEANLRYSQSIHDATLSWLKCCCENQLTCCG
jgi:hypothetical protein